MQSLFQGKPTVVRDSSDSAGHRDRPQAVTRHLFAPLATTVQQEQQQQEQPQLSCRPQTATASIFAPRTEDMNKGFLTFSEDQPGLTSAYSPSAIKKIEFFPKRKPERNRGSLSGLLSISRKKKRGPRENDKERYDV